MTRNSSLGEILTPRDAAQLINLDLVNLPSPPNGSIQIHNPTDRLSRTKAMYHFTPDLNVAKKYAAWAKRRDNVASVIIVQIAIQNSAIEAMRHPDLQRVSWQVRSGQSSSAIAVQ
uniref:Uncharacterized protein n=2 Tax=Fusarium oxysporum TaxID=5507 RepID=A0A0D2XP46_FUSOF